MNILFLTRRFAPDIGGVETHVLKLSEELLKDGHTVTIITESYTSDILYGLNWQIRYINAGGEINEERAYNPVKMSSQKMTKRKNSLITPGQEKNTNESKVLPEITVYSLPKIIDGWKKKFLIWSWLWKNRSHFENNEIIHCHDVFFWYFPFRLLYPRKKVFITFHGYEGVFPPARKAILIRKLSERMSSGVICVGDYIKKWYGANPKFVTYGGVSPREQSKDTTSGKNESKKGVKILLIGRLANDIGVNLYTTALILLRANHIPFKMKALGDGELRSDVEKVGTVLGFVSNPDEFINKTDIVFASSYLTILESIARGKLVIAVYDNPLKGDYLKLAPFSKWIEIVSNVGGVNKIVEQYEKSKAKYATILSEGKQWANSQTWSKVKEMYYSLWQV